MPFEIAQSHQPEAIPAMEEHPETTAEPWLGPGGEHIEVTFGDTHEIVTFDIDILFLDSPFAYRIQRILRMSQIRLGPNPWDDVQS